MATRAEQDEWLKQLGIKLPAAAQQPAQAAAGGPPGTAPQAVAQPAPAGLPLTKTPKPLPTQGDPPPTDAAGLVEVWPEQLVALKSGLDGLAATIQASLRQDPAIDAAAARIPLDPRKTDAVAQAAAKLGGALTAEEHSRLKRGQSEIAKSKLNIETELDRISEAKDHLAAFLQLDLEEVHAPEDKEKMGHEVATIYDTLINIGKAVIDIVTGDFVQYGAWIMAQATSEVAGGDVVKDRIEEMVDGIEEKQNELEDGLNQAIGELNKFRSKEIKALTATLEHLRSELNKWLDLLKNDVKDFGEDLGEIAAAHKKDAGDLRPVMEVYQKISEANDLLSGLAVKVAQNTALSDKKWPFLLAPLGSLDENTAVGYGLPEGWIAVVYKNPSGRHVFLVAGTGGTFAASRSAAPAALDALAANFVQLQQALAAQPRVAAMAAQWSQALSAGLNSRAKH
jgi:hypothetical protein